jgi:hypothetical protein
MPDEELPPEASQPDDKKPDDKKPPERKRSRGEQKVLAHFAGFALSGLLANPRVITSLDVTPDDVRTIVEMAVVMSEELTAHFRSADPQFFTHLL